MTYHSKLDVYIVAAIILAIGVFLLGDYWIAGPVLLVLFLCAYPQSYETKPNGLVIRTALAKISIPYQAIRDIEPATDDPGVFFFMADRIRIRYGLGSDILISPADRVAFISDVAERAPHLMRRGQRLTALFA